VKQIGKFVLQSFDKGEEIADDVVGIKVLQVDPRVIDIDEILYGVGSTSKIFV
jgi:hypothetical protein